MSVYLNYFTLFFALIGACNLPRAAWAIIAGPQTKIHVRLLGQPCLLQGPFDELTLKTIHSIGPAQIYPTLSTTDLNSSLDEAQKSLEKIKRVNSIPSLLDRYRDKLGKRLEAQIAFFEGLNLIKTTHKSVHFLETGKKHLKNNDFRQFEILLKKIDSPGKGTLPIQELMEQIFDLYNESIEPDPEAEFHRAIKKINVEYMCSFEESEENSGD